MNSIFSFQHYEIPFYQVLYIDKEFYTPGKTTAETGGVAVNHIRVMLYNEEVVSIANEGELYADRFLDEWRKWADFRHGCAHEDEKVYEYDKFEKASFGSRSNVYYCGYCRDRCPDIHDGLINVDTDYEIHFCDFKCRNLFIAATECKVE